MDVGTIWYMFWTNSNRLKFVAIVISYLFNKSNIIIRDTVCLFR